MLATKSKLNKRKSTRRMAARSSHCLLIVILSLLLASETLVNGRYLPTRSDNSEVEALKEIIRGLLTRPTRLDQPTEQRMEPTGQYLAWAGANGLSPNQPGRQGLHELDRRAAEMVDGNQLGGSGG